MLRANSALKGFEYHIEEARILRYKPLFFGCVKEPYEVQELFEGVAIQLLLDFQQAILPFGHVDTLVKPLIV